MPLETIGYTSEPESLEELRSINPDFVADGSVVSMRGRSSVGDGGEGDFHWEPSDMSTEVGNDEVTVGEGDGNNFVAPTTDKTGKSGAWVRQGNEEWNTENALKTFTVPQIQPHWAVSNPVLEGSDVSDVGADFVADPFLFYDNGTWYCFFEIKVTSDGSQTIGYATSPDGLTWAYQAEILTVSGVNLSYPQVFKWQGTYYMLPNYNSADVVLYKASSWPTSWTQVETLLSYSEETRDATIFRFKGKWWLYFGDAAGDIHLYFSNSLVGGEWTAHPGNPIISQATPRRPGGRPLVRGENILLPMQDNTPTGNSVDLFSVAGLTTSAITVSELTSVSPIIEGHSPPTWTEIGMHHVDIWESPDGGSLVAVDAFKSGGVFAIGIYEIARGAQIGKDADGKLRIPATPRVTTGQYETATSDIVLVDTNGIAFRSTVANAWDDSVSARFLQVGDAAGANVMFTSKNGGEMGRCGISSDSGLQVTLGPFNSVPAPNASTVLELYNGSNNRVVRVDSSGNFVLDSGDLFLGSPTTQTSAAAGANGDVPAQVDGYLVVSINGVNKAIPYYADS